MHRLLLVTACVALGPVAVSAQTWREVRSPHFIVVTDGSEGRGRDVAWQFEQIRAAILAGFPWARPQLDRPVLIVAARDEKSMRELLPGVFEKAARDLVTVSITSTLQDRHVIVLQSDYKAVDEAGTVNPYWASYWSYAELMLTSAFERPLPRWFVRGLAAVLSNSLVKRNEIDFGRPIPWMLQTLNQSRVALPQLLEMRSGDAYLANDVNRQRFDAQSWGVVHYLLFGRPPERAGAMDQLTKLLSEGVSSTDAIAQTFGSVDALDAAYREFQRRPVSQFARLAIDTKINRDDFSARALPPNETSTLRALVHTAFGRPEDARTQLAAALAGANALPDAHVVEGLLLERENAAPGAVAAFTRAVDLKSQSFYAHYRVGVELARPGGANDRTGAERNYRQATTLNPAYAPAHKMLASLLASGPMPELAFESARRAASLDPADSNTRLVYAYVLRRMRQLPAANGQALAARSLARTDTERQQAQQMVDDLAADMARLAPATPAAVK